MVINQHLDVLINEAADIVGLSKIIYHVEHDYMSWEVSKSGSS
jgi:hypothetical protein